MNDSRGALEDLCFQCHLLAPQGAARGLAQAWGLVEIQIRS